MDDRSLLGTLAFLAGTLLFGACASGAAVQTAPAPVQPVSPELASRLIEATAPVQTRRLQFDWVLREGDARFTGKGVARVESPYHARLDLFGPRGEGYLSAALVDMEVRLPPGVSTTNVPLPPPPLFWSALGALRPPEGSTLTSTSQDGGHTRLVYSGDESTWTFTFEGANLKHAEWQHARTGRQTVELTPGADGTPREAVYRDWPAFRQLTLTLTDAANVDSFPSDIWTPGRGF